MKPSFNVNKLFQFSTLRTRELLDGASEPYPLPGDAPSAARIVADLLVKGFGLREDAGLDFILYGDEAAS